MCMARHSLDLFRWDLKQKKGIMEELEEADIEYRILMRKKQGIKLVTENLMIGSTKK